MNYYSLIGLIENHSKSVREDLNEFLSCLFVSKKLFVDLLVEIKLDNLKIYASLIRMLKRLLKYENL